jgi:hypothetical protein
MARVCFTSCSKLGSFSTKGSSIKNHQFLLRLECVPIAGCDFIFYGAWISIVLPFWAYIFTLYVLFFKDEKGCKSPLTHH